jgi:ATP-dependent Clp protease ATP-binding subunit ClpX
MENKKCTCYFCGNTSDDHPELEFVLHKDNMGICSDCVSAIYNKLLNVNDSENSEESIIWDEEEIEEQKPLKKQEIPRPELIKAYLDQHIIGQESAKQIISVAAYNHYKYLVYAAEHAQDQDALELQRSNILVAGSTGSGLQFYYI